MQITRVHSRIVHVVISVYGHLYCHFLVCAIYRILHEQVMSMNNNYKVTLRVEFLVFGELLLRVTTGKNLCLLGMKLFNKIIRLF